MRANEFVSESKEYSGRSGMRKEWDAAIPDGHIYPDLDNSSGYMAYRFGLAVAGLPNQKMEVAGPQGLKMVTIGYTPADEEILDAAAGLVGTPKVRLTSKGSRELEDTNKTSPVSNWNPRNKKNVK